MSRSRRKNPCCGWTTAESNKWFKQKAHRRERKYVKNQLVNVTEDIDLYINKNQFFSQYDAPKDGMIHWFNEPFPEEWLIKLLRK